MNYADPQALDLPGHSPGHSPNHPEIGLSSIDLESELDSVIETIFLKPQVSNESQVSTCRHCQHYTHEGRRGGYCQSLNVGVQGSWQACPLAVSTFKGLDPVEALICWIPRIQSPLEIQTH